MKEREKTTINECDENGRERKKEDHYMREETMKRNMKNRETV